MTEQWLLACTDRDLYSQQVIEGTPATETLQLPLWLALDRLYTVCTKPAREMERSVRGPLVKPRIRRNRPESFRD